MHIGGGFALKESMVYVLSSGLTNHPLDDSLDHSLVRGAGLGQDSSSSIFQPFLVPQRSDTTATDTSRRVSTDSNNMNDSKNEYSALIDIPVDASSDSNITIPPLPALSIQPPVYLHEVHVYLDNLEHIDLIQLEQQAKDACIHICQQYRLEDFYLSCDIVDVYTFTTNTSNTVNNTNSTTGDSTNSTTSTDTYTEYVTVAFQVCYRSSTLALSRAQADLIRGLVETALPIALNLRYIYTPYICTCLLYIYCELFYLYV